MVRFALISDVHIKNFKKHKQYNIVFDQVYTVLKQKKPDYILLLGDLFHSKNAIFAEAYFVASNFLRKLSKIAETHVILGNHEVFSKNLDRLDTLTPVIDALNLSTIKFHKYTDQYTLKENITLHTLSILDKDNWKVPVVSTNTNIALFHGTVEGSISDSGWVVDKGEINIDLLRKFDYAFCGDIHAQQSLDSTGKMLYVGSLIQNNFGEKDDKGIIIYDIHDKNSFEMERIIFPNPAPFVTIELEAGDLPPNLDVKEGSVVRVVSSENVTYDTVNKILDIVKSKYKPESAVYISKISTNGGLLSNGDISDSDRENLRDISVQEKLIKEFLWDYEISESVLKKVFELNKKFNVVVEQDETGIARNVNWSLKKVEWSNLFNYGENNSIDYSVLKGIVGLFGASFKGKTSAIEVILYTIFNAITKNARKNYNIINQNCSKGFGKVQITIGDNLYIIERQSEKYIKKVKGEEIEEARTTVDFKRVNTISNEEENLNGADRNETEKNIRQIFGTIDDFLLTTISSQFGALGFIEEGSTKRKEILAKFLDLDIFEKKFKALKTEASDLKILIKKYGELSDFKKRIDDTKKEISNNKQQIEDNKDICFRLTEEKKEIDGVISLLEKKIESAPKIPIKIADILGKIDVLASKEVSLVSRESSKIEENKKLSKRLKEITNDEVNREQKKQSYDKLIQNYHTCKDVASDLSWKLDQKKKELQNCNKRIKLLEEVPCGDLFPKCKFIADSFLAKEERKKLIEEQGELVILMEANTEKYPEAFELDEARRFLLECIEIEKETNEINRTILENKNKISLLQNEKLKLSQEKERLLEQQRIYEENKEIIEDSEGVMFELENQKSARQQKEEQIKQCNDSSMELYKKHGSMEQQLEMLRKNKKDLIKIREEYEAYDLLAKCFHSDGIPFVIIKQQLPFINSEIGKVLASVVGFKVFFESENDKLNLFIQHKNYSPRPLEMGSGAEKVLASLAIRMGLTKISSLPRCSMLVLDEPVLALDSNILEAFSKLLGILKEQHEPIILITHLEALKDIVDNEIILSTKGNYAYINQ